MTQYRPHKNSFSDALTSVTFATLGDPRLALCHRLCSFDCLNTAISNQGSIRLFRYQPFDERNVRDFLMGAIHMSAPSSFNDVNEGWQRFDEGIIENEMEQARHIGIQDKYAKGWDTIFEAIQQHHPITFAESPEEMAAIWTNAAKDKDMMAALHSALLALAGYGQLRIRSSARCASFSETVSSASMWDRYADRHRGFALEYEFSAFGLPCSFGRENPDEMPKAGILIPVIYGARDDLSALYAAFCHYGLSQGTMNNLAFVSLVNMFARKAAEWSYEKEWRILSAQGSAESLLYARKSPVAIYAGAKMNHDEKCRLTDAGNSIGLRVNQMVVDYESEDYSLKADR